jgi:hypothetical protein
MTLHEIAQKVLDIFLVCMGVGAVIATVGALIALAVGLLEDLDFRREKKAFELRERNERARLARLADAKK